MSVANSFILVDVTTQTHNWLVISTPKLVSGWAKRSNGGDGPNRIHRGNRADGANRSRRSNGCHRANRADWRYRTVWGHWRCGNGWAGRPHWQHGTYGLHRGNRTRRRSGSQGGVGPTGATGATGVTRSQGANGPTGSVFNADGVLLASGATIPATDTFVFYLVDNTAGP